MTNAKSRLVRVLAVALVVLMVVPAALVGCGGGADDNSAALSEALAAAQAAKEAADAAKAAADKAAQDAADKIAAAEKAAQDAQKKADEAAAAASKLEEELKKPASTTEIPVDSDKAVADAYATDMLYNEKMEFLILKATYLGTPTISGVENLSANYFGMADTFADLFLDAHVAILRAPSVDYINQIVAQLRATLEGTPTRVELLIAAYEAIDFASDLDVVDVAYAKALKNALTPFTPAEQLLLDEYKDGEVDVLKAIDEEFYRYTGSGAGSADKVLYDTMYNWVATENIKGAIEALGVSYKTTTPANIEFDITTLAYSKDTAKAIKSIQDTYEKFFSKFFEDKAIEENYADFCQAFIGADFLLYQEGDYLSDVLAALEERNADLVDAAAEFKADIYPDFKKPAAATADGSLKDYSKWVAVNDEIKAWAAKYEFSFSWKAADTYGAAGSFVKESAPMNAIIDSFFATTDVYEAFLNNLDMLAAKNEVLVAAQKLDAALIDAAIEQAADYGFYDYKKYNGTVAALADWYLGTLNNTTTPATRDADGLDDQAWYVAAASAETEKRADVEYILKTAFGAKDIEADLIALTGSQKEKTDAIKAAADVVNKAVDKYKEGENVADIAAKAFFKEDDELKYNAANAASKLGLFFVELVGSANMTKEVETNTPNYDLVDYEAIEVLWKGVDSKIEDFKADALEIVKAYIALKGVLADEDGNELDLTAYANADVSTMTSGLDLSEYTFLKFDGKIYDLEKIELTPAYIETLNKLTTAYNNLLDGNDTIKDVANLAELDAEGEDDPVPFKAADVKKYFAEIRTAYHAYMAIVSADANTFNEQGFIYGYGKWSGYNKTQLFAANTKFGAEAFTGTVPDSGTITLSGNTITVNADNKAVVEYFVEINNYLATKIYSKDMVNFAPYEVAFPRVLYGAQNYNGVCRNDSILAVDFYDYIQYKTDSKTEDQKAIGFDATGFVNAINKKAEENYSKWLNGNMVLYNNTGVYQNASFLTQVVATDFSKVTWDKFEDSHLAIQLDNQVSYLLATGFVTVEDSFEVDGETFTYTITANDVATLDAAYTGGKYVDYGVFTLYNADGELLYQADAADVTAAAPVTVIKNLDTEDYPAAQLQIYLAIEDTKLVVKTTTADYDNLSAFLANDKNAAATANAFDVLNASADYMKSVNMLKTVTEYGKTSKYKGWDKDLVPEMAKAVADLKVYNALNKLFVAIGNVKTAGKTTVAAQYALDWYNKTAANTTVDAIEQAIVRLAAEAEMVVASTPTATTVIEAAPVAP